MRVAASAFASLSFNCESLGSSSSNLIKIEMFSGRFAVSLQFAMKSTMLFSEPTSLRLHIKIHSIVSTVHLRRLRLTVSGGAKHDLRLGILIIVAQSTEFP